MHELSLAKPGAPVVAKEEDASLVKAARRDPAAFAALYWRYVTPVYRYLYSRVSHAADAEDLTAQVFTEALEGLSRYREWGSFAACRTPLKASRAIAGCAACGWPRWLLRMGGLWI